MNLRDESTFLQTSYTIPANLILNVKKLSKLASSHGLVVKADGQEVVGSNPTPYTEWM